MKKSFIIFFLIFFSFNIAFAQKPPSVAVLPFESGNRVTPDEAAAVTSKVIAELSSWGTLDIVQENAADFIVRSSLARQGNSVVLQAETIEAKSGKTLNESREQSGNLNDISVAAFSIKLVEKIPLPNYLLGTWQSIVDMPDGQIICVIEFKSDRSVKVERYDTLEYRRNNSLRYEGYGSGSYSYALYLSRRNVTVNSRQVQIDATAGINLKLEETLPAQTNVNQSGLALVFSSDKNSFEIAGGSLPCGRNFDGPSVYPSASIGFTHFIKIK